MSSIPWSAWCDACWWQVLNKYVLHQINMHFLKYIFISYTKKKEILLQINSPENGVLWLFQRWQFECEAPECFTNSCQSICLFSWSYQYRLFSWVTEPLSHFTDNWGLDRLQPEKFCFYLFYTQGCCLSSCLKKFLLLKRKNPLEYVSYFQTEVYESASKTLKCFMFLILKYNLTILKFNKKHQFTFI